MCAMAPTSPCWTIWRRCLIQDCLPALPAPHEPSYCRGPSRRNMSEMSRPVLDGRNSQPSYAWRDSTTPRLHDPTMESDDDRFAARVHRHHNIHMYIFSLHIHIHIQLSRQQTVGVTTSLNPPPPTATHRRRGLPDDPTAGTTSVVSPRSHCCFAPTKPTNHRQSMAVTSGTIWAP